MCLLLDVKVFVKVGGVFREENFFEKFFHLCLVTTQSKSIFDFGLQYITNPFLISDYDKKREAH